MSPRHQDTPDEAAAPSSSTSSSRNKFPRDWLVRLLQNHPNPSTPLEFRDKVLAVAPMVDQSDLPFRLLCRKYGANVAFTPMIHAKLFCTSPNYRKKFFNFEKGTLEQDRPLICQLCGSNPEYVVKTALLLQPHCDGIDINCGCPQNIAKRGQYGAFLLEQPEVLLPLVETLSQTLDIPLSVKVRLLPSGVEDSLQLYKQLQDAGASMITIHGRTRLQKQFLTGAADWNAIRQAKEVLHIPVLANGSMSNLDEIRACLEVTGADGVLCSEALLEYPPMYMESVVGKKRVGPGRLQVAREYLELAKRYPPQEGGQGSGIKCIRVHLHRFLHADIHTNADLRDFHVHHTKTLDDFETLLERIAKLHQDTNHKVEDEQLSWYVRHRVQEETPTRVEHNKQERESSSSTDEQEELDVAECTGCLFDDGDDDGDY